ncbi:MAG: hypothetical protein ACI8TP_000798 [Acidimicrobiales bacterium]|jgi:hypothetical protein
MAAYRVVKNEDVKRIHHVLVGLEPIARRNAWTTKGEVIDDHDFLSVCV